jgi:hypothetical protein
MSSANEQLERYYKSIQAGTMSRASDYARQHTDGQYITQLSQTRYLAASTKGVTALDALQAQMSEVRLTKDENEISTRALLTRIYGLQCELALLSTVTGEIFDKALADPLTQTGTTGDRIHEAIVGVDKMISFVRAHGAATKMSMAVNNEAYSKIKLLSETVSPPNILPTILKSADTSTYRADALERYKKFESGKYIGGTMPVPPKGADTPVHD